MTSGGNEKGMTLLEVVVAIAILATCMALMWGSFAQTADLQESVNRRSDTVAMGRTAMERMAREVSMAFLSTHVSPTSSYNTVFKGLDKDPFDEVVFTSLSHEKLYRDAKEGDQTELTWFRGEDDEGGAGLATLLHREAPRIDGDPERGGVVLPLAYRVKSLNLRYYDAVKKEWVDQWDTQGVDTPGRLPRAVEISLTLEDEEEQSRVFSTRTLVNRMNR